MLREWGFLGRSISAWSGGPTMEGSNIHPPQPLIDRLQGCLGNGLLSGGQMLGEIPASDGAYVLLLHLERVVAIDLPRLGPDPIPAGWHLYAGSANGPGGLRARLARHFRPDKKAHWHIDRLTMIKAPEAAFSIPNGSECAIVSNLIASGAFRFTSPGFGATDCRQCQSHLLTWRR